MRPPKQPACIALLLFLTLVLPLGAAQTDGFQADRARARAEVAEELDELARWCQSKRLFESRDRAYGHLLRYEPEHEDARRFLKYKKRGGEWQRDRYRTPKDYGKKYATELARREDEIERRFRTRLLAWVDRADVRLAEDELDEVWDELLAFAPDDARARSARGEVRDAAGAWVLCETHTARERRAELAAAMERIAADVPEAERVSLTAREDTLDVPWTGAFATPDVRVVGTCSASRIAEYAQLAETALRVFQAVLDVETGLEEPLVVYVLMQESDKRTFLEQHEAFGNPVHPDAGDHASYWIAANELVLFPVPDDFVRDHLVRQMAAWMLVQSYGLDPSEAWALEGITTQLTLLVTGRNLSRFGELGEDLAHGTRRPLPLPKSASELLAAGAPIFAEYVPNALPGLLGKDLASLDRNDYLVSCVLSSFLVEGCPDRVGPLLELIGRGSAPDWAFSQVFDAGLERLGARVQRWAREKTYGPSHFSPPTAAVRGGK